MSASVWRGFSVVNWRFLTEPMRLAGAEGGIFHNLIGTLILLSTALIVTTPLSVGTALVTAFYIQSERWRRLCLLCLYVLNGVPSLLFGLFGFIVFVSFFGWGKSWLTGGILLGFMILPTVSVALVERLRSLPPLRMEAAAGLGLSRSRIVWFVLLPQCLGGWVSGSFLGLARAAGETAPILFTATIFAGASIPSGIKENPVLTLPYHIFILAQDSFDQAIGGKVWGTALVLLMLAFCMSLVVLPVRLRIHEEADHV